MAVHEPFPELHELLQNIGAAGSRIAGMEASEGAAGNISVMVGWPLEVRRQFPLQETFTLPLPVPALAGRQIIVTGSGRRLRDVSSNPDANLAVVRVSDDGLSGVLQTAPHRLFDRITSEFNSHLAVHHDQVLRTGTNYHAVIHAQPIHLTYLSHVPDYGTRAALNRALIRWQPETIVNLPEGIGVLPFMLPGSAALMAASVEALRHHRVILWSKHGVMARSDMSVTKAADRVEYAETAARYEYMDLTVGGRGQGLTTSELKTVVDAFEVTTSLVE